MDDDLTLTTDVKSDISFMRRQKELRNIYREFKSAIDTIQNASMMDETQPTDVKLEETAPESILNEIEQLESEISEVSRLLERFSTSPHPTAHSIIKQVRYLQDLVPRLRTRAAALL